MDEYVCELAVLLAGGGWSRFELVAQLLFQRVEFAGRRPTTDN